MYLYNGYNFKGYNIKTSAGVTDDQRNNLTGQTAEKNAYHVQALREESVSCPEEDLCQLWIRSFEQAKNLQLGKGALRYGTKEKSRDHTFFKA